MSNKAQQQSLWPLVPQGQVLWQDALTHTHIPPIFLAAISVSRLPWSSNYACCTHKTHVRPKDEPASGTRIGCIRPVQIRPELEHMLHLNYAIVEDDWELSRIY